MDFRIPTSYTVGQQEMNVIYKEQDDMPTGSTLGRCRVAKGEILISKDQTKTSMENTFVHEAFHSVLDTAGYDELSADETFVSTIASLLLEIIKTSK